MKKLIGAAALALLWQLAAVYAKSRLFPPPTDIAAVLLRDPYPIARHCAHSVYRLLAGGLCAVAAGLPIGLLLGYFRKANRALSPLLYIFAPIPKIALLPLIMLFFGIGNASKIFIIFIIMVFQVIVAVRDAAAKTPAEYFMSCRTVGADTPFIFMNIVLPASLPGLFTAIRIGLAASVSVLFFAESFGTTWGVGFYVMDMWMRLDYNRMYLGIIAFGLIGFLGAALTDRLEKAVCPWTDF